MEVSSRRPAPMDLKIAEKQKRAQNLKKAIDKIEEIQDGLKHPIWLHVEDRMRTKVRQIDDALMNYQDMAGHDRVFFGMIGEKKAATEVLAVKDFIGARERFEAELETLTKEIRELVRVIPATDSSHRK